MAGPGLRHGSAWRPPIGGSASRRSGCSSATACSRPSATPIGGRHRRGRGVLDAHHDLSVRPDGARQRRALRGRRDQLRCARPAAACRTRRGTGSTSTPTWRSRSASSTSCSSGRTSSTTRSRPPTGSVLYVATIALILAFRVGQPVCLSVRHRLRVDRTSSPRRPGVFSIYLTGRDLDRLADPLRPVLRAGASSPATAGGAAIRSRSRRPRTGPGCGSRSRSSATGRRSRSAHPDRDARVHRGSVRHPDRRPPHARTRCSSSPAASGSPRCGRCSKALPARPGDLTLLYRVRDARTIVFRDELETLARPRRARPLPGRSRDAPGPRSARCRGTRAPRARHRASTTSTSADRSR